MKNFLLPYAWKFPGVLFVLSGIVLAIFYIWFDFRFSMPVFAVFSSFMETKMFVTFITNFADELILILLITGLGFLVFSREKKESEKLDSIRYNAMVKAMILINLLLIFSVLFVYGSGFIALLILNLFSFSLSYLCFFHFLKKRIYK